MNVGECIKALNGEHTTATLAKEIGIAEKRLRKALKAAGVTYSNKHPKGWHFENEKSILEHDISEYVPKSSSMQQSRTPKNINKSLNERQRTQNDLSFTSEEINVLKQFIKERQENTLERSALNIYHELITNVQSDNKNATRRSYTISNDVLSRFEKFAKKHRLPQQELVELALIRLLNDFN